MSIASVGQRADLVSSELEERVRRVVAEQLGVDGEQLAPELSFADDLAADSLDLLAIAVAVEEELGIVLRHRVLGGIRTYQDLVDVVLALAAHAVEHAKRGASLGRGRRASAYADSGPERSVGVRARIAFG
jgi:acyl carrier protein